MRKFDITEELSLERVMNLERENKGLGATEAGVISSDSENRSSAKPNLDEGGCCEISRCRSK
jgi:hypothetical protein